MKRFKFYTKYKANDPAYGSPLFYKGNWWQLVLIVVLAVSIGPLIVFKHQRSVPVSTQNYLKLVEYCFLIVLPLVSFFLWLNWRESVKLSRGYRWIGEFCVTNKRTSLLSCYLRLTPGNSKVKVDREFYDRMRVGDCVMIRRDALGDIEGITKVKRFSKRLAKPGIKHFGDRKFRPKTSNDRK